MVVVQINPNIEEFNSILACSDSTIKVIKDNGELMTEHKFKSSIISLSLSE